MIPVRNAPVPVPQPRRRRYATPEYRCKFCGASESGYARYSEIVGGRARLMSIDGDLDDYEQDDNSGDMEILGYYCGECDREENDIERLFTPDVEDEEEDEED